MGGGKGSKTEYEVAEYYLSVDFGICHGPLDSINEVWIKEKRAWAGRIRDNKTVPINEIELFGGKKKEGGEDPNSVKYLDELRSKAQILNR